MPRELKKTTIGTKLFEDSIEELKQMIDDKMTQVLSRELVKTKSEFWQVQKDNKLFKSNIQNLVAKVTRDRKEQEKRFYDGCRDSLDKRYDKRFRSLQGLMGALSTNSKKKIKELEESLSLKQISLIEENVNLRQQIFLCSHRVKASLLLSLLALMMGFIGIFS
jgi:hypothetical protein